MSKILFCAKEYPTTELQKIAEAMIEIGHEVTVGVTVGTDCLEAQYLSGVKIVVDPTPIVPETNRLTFCKKWDLVIIYGEQGYAGAAHEFGRLIKSPTLYLPLELGNFKPSTNEHVLKYKTFIGFSIPEHIEYLKGRTNIRRVRLPISISSSNLKFLTWKGIPDTIYDIEDIIAEKSFNE